jgi:outer membrane protein assembly factor BamE
MRKQLFFLSIISISAALLALNGCGSIPYRPNIQQGNVIEKPETSKLHLGMTKHEVIDVLGDPVLVNPFDDNSWAYVSTKQIRGGKIEKQRLDLQFDNDKLIKIN